MLRRMKGTTVLVDPPVDEPLAVLRAMACWYLEPLVFSWPRLAPLGELWCGPPPGPCPEAQVRAPVSLAPGAVEPAGLPPVTVVVLGPGAAPAPLEDVAVVQEDATVQGCNRALKAAAGRDVVLLHGGVEVSGWAWLGELRRVAHADPDIAAVGCRVVNGEGRLLQAGHAVVRHPARALALGEHEFDVGQYGRTRAIEAAGGGCMYLTRHALERLGPLDEGYGHSHADLDYCLRAGRTGLKTVLAGRVTLRARATPAPNPEDAATFARRWAQDVPGVELVLRTGGHPEALVDALQRAGVRVRLEPFEGPQWKAAIGSTPRERAFRRRRVSRRATRVRVVDAVRRVRPNEVAWLQPGAHLHREDEPVEVWSDLAVGVDADRFHPAIRRFPSEEFVVLAWVEQADWPWVGFFARAFQRAFSKRDPVQLNVISAVEFKSTAFDRLGAPISVAVAPRFPDYQKGCFYRSADCVLAAPGWRVPLEAAACGVPVVAPRSGPHRAFLDEDLAWLFDWSQGDLERALRQVYENQEEALERASRASARVLADWTLETTAAALAERLARLQQRSGRP